MDNANYRDSGFISEVAEDVLGVLRKSRFFGRLEDRFGAMQATGAPPQCPHSFALSIQILRELGMDAQDIGDVLAVFRFRGAACDCEVLQNVDSRRRKKMSFWPPTPSPAAPDWLMTQKSASTFIN